MKLQGIELPDTIEILTKLRELKSATEKEVNSVRAFLFDTVEKFEEAFVTLVADKEYEEDPSSVLETLKSLHMYNGGLVALAEGLYRRARFLAYKDLTEKSTVTTDIVEPSATPRKGKLAMGDREQYVKGFTADLEGLVKLLNERQTNIQQRIWGYR